jgi:hypothetical protein
MACVSKAWRALCDDPVCWPSLRLPFGFRGVFGQGVAGRDGTEAALSAAAASRTAASSGRSETKGDSKAGLSAASAATGSQLFAALSAKFTSLKTLQIIGPRVLV